MLGEAGTAITSARSFGIASLKAGSEITCKLYAQLVTRYLAKL
jgi:hypothetical protein